VDPNYLAVGLDKVRHDPSLVVWDIETAAASLSPPVNSPDARSPRFSQRLPTRIPPIDSRPNEPRPLQQYGSTEAITSLTFVPSSAGPSLLMAGVGMKWLRLHDLRSPTTSTILTIATKAVYGLCPDPFDDFKVASFGDDGGIRIWDRRRSSEPVIAFSEADASGDGGRLSILAEIAFSPTRRGLLGSLERDSSVVRFWDLISNVPVEEADHSRLNFPDNGGFNRPVKSDMGDRWRVDEELPPPILSHTRKGTLFDFSVYINH
jgi:WD40 repeat protein